MYHSTAAASSTVVATHAAPAPLAAVMVCEVFAAAE
jgi:hypothetical protein